MPNVENEERSFAPRDEEEVNLEPIRTPSKASNATLARGINRFHKCLEEHINSTDTNFQELKNELSALRETLAPKGRTPVAFLGGWQVGWRQAVSVFLGISGAIASWRALVVLWPAVERFGLSLMHWINTGAP